MSTNNPLDAISSIIHYQPEFPYFPKSIEVPLPKSSISEISKQKEVKKKILNFIEKLSKEVTGPNLEAVKRFRSLVEKNPPSNIEKINNAKIHALTCYSISKDIHGQQIITDDQVFLSINYDIFEKLIEKSKNNKIYYILLASLIIKEGATINDILQNKSYYIDLFNLQEAFNAFSSNLTIVNNPAYLKMLENLLAHLTEAEAVGYRAINSYLEPFLDINNLFLKTYQNETDPNVKHLIAMTTQSFQVTLNKTIEEKEKELKKLIFSNLIAPMHQKLAEKLCQLKKGLSYNKITGQIDVTKHDDIDFLMNPEFLPNRGKNLP